MPRSHSDFIPEKVRRSLGGPFCFAPHICLAALLREICPATVVGPCAFLEFCPPSLPGLCAFRRVCPAGFTGPRAHFLGACSYRRQCTERSMPKCIGSLSQAAMGVIFLSSWGPQVFCSIRPLLRRFARCESKNLALFATFFRLRILACP